MFSLPHSLAHVIKLTWSSNFLHNFLREVLFLLFEGGYYWFLPFLFCMFVISKVCLKKWSIRKNMIILVMCILIYLGYSFFPFVRFEIIQRFLYNYIFFIAGYLVKNYVKPEKAWRERESAIVLLEGIISIAICMIYILFQYNIIKLMAAFTAIVFCTSLATKMNGKYISRISEGIGKNTMIIYLFDGYIIAMEKKLLVPFFAMIPILVIVNIIVPMIIRKNIVSKFRILKFICGE